MAGPIQPLLPNLPTIEQQKENLKTGLAIAGLLTIARAFPQTAAPIARYGFGVRLGAAGQVIGFNPLAVTNLLPFPFGFGRAKDFGQKPNYYLPPGSGKYLPDFIPGAEEQTEEDRKAKQGTSNVADYPSSFEIYRQANRTLDQQLAELKELQKRLADSPNFFGKPDPAAVQKAIEFFEAQNRKAGEAIGIGPDGKTLPGFPGHPEFGFPIPPSLAARVGVALAFPSGSTPGQLPSVAGPSASPTNPAPISPQLPTVPELPTGPSASPSPGAPGGPLNVPDNNTPGQTPGQPNWPSWSPDPSNTFPDEILQHRHGDP